MMFDYQTHTAWRNQMYADLKVTAIAIAILGLIFWVSTSVSVEGAPVVESQTEVVVIPEVNDADIWLVNGSAGEDVTEIQSIFSQHGWTIAVDGDYGSQTESVVTRFQTMSGLLPDGIVGPITWDALKSVGYSKAVRGEKIQVGTPPIPSPIDFNCESWRPLVESYGMPWDWAQSIMKRESTCSNAYNGNSNTGDKSYGPFQVNRYTQALRNWYDAAGYTQAVMETPEGAVAAAGALYYACGSGPWNKAAGYTCNGSGQLKPLSEW